MEAIIKKNITFFYSPGYLRLLLIQKKKKPSDFRKWILSKQSDFNIELCKYYIESIFLFYVKFW